MFRGPASVETPVSTVDLPATLYDYCGMGSPDNMQGESLMGMLRGGDDTREVAYSEWNLSPARCGVELQLRTVRTRTHKMMVDLLSGEGEMYNLVEDPQELHNLFNEPAHCAMRAALEARVRARPGPVLTTFAPPVGLA